MSGRKRRTPDYLGHMLEAVNRITDYMSGLSNEAFRDDNRTQDAVIRNLEIIGEAAHNVLKSDPVFIAANPEVPWLLAYRMRNMLSHGYADVDLEVVWSTTKSSLPDLHIRLMTLLARKP